MEVEHSELTGLLDNDHPQYLLKSGGTMSGALLLSRVPTGSTEAVTKGYADNIAAQAASVAKVTVSSTAPGSPKVGDIWVLP